MSGDAQRGHFERPDRAEVLAKLRGTLDRLDEQTRLPGELPLREAVAEQARQRLAELPPSPDEHPSWCKCQRVCGGDQ